MLGLNTKEIFLISYYELLSNLFRSILSILSIIIGIAVFISIISLNEGLKQKMLNSIEKLGGYNVFTIGPSKKNALQNGKETSFRYPLTLDTIEKLSANFQFIFAPEIIAPPIAGQTKYTVFGVTPEYFKIFKFNLVKGRMISPVDMLNENNVIVINKEIAQYYSYNLNNVIGKYISISNYNFEIIGIVESRLSYIPASTLVMRIDKAPIKNIYVKVNNYKDIQSAVENVNEYLDHISQIGGLFNYWVPSEGTKRLYEIELSFSRLIIATAILTVLVGGIGIMNIMLSSVKERIREIGIKKATGAKNKQIFIQFLIESLLIFLVGGFIGIVLGIIGVDTFSHYLLKNYITGETEAIISLKVLFYSLIVPLISGLTFGLYPAIKAMKISPIDSLRYE